MTANGWLFGISSNCSLCFLTSWIKGTKNDKVFPFPVSEDTKTLLPLNISGIDNAWKKLNSIITCKLPKSKYLNEPD